jgi:SNF family Na+-dependent transporter
LVNQQPTIAAQKSCLTEAARESLDFIRVKTHHPVIQMSHYNAMCQSAMSMSNSNNIMQMTESKIKINDRAQHRKEWGNPTEFLMTCIGFAVGLGNVWRFPYLCFKNGGSAFVIAFSSMLFFIGLPLFFLEITLAQFSKMGPLEIWKVVPAFRGLGICSLLLSTFIAFYYNILICYSLIYAVSSFIPTLPWTRCDFSWNTAKCCMGSSSNVSCAADSESPAKQYFNNYVLDISDGIGDFGYINWKIAISLLVCWLMIFLALSQGVQSLGK